MSLRPLSAPLLVGLLVFGAPPAEAGGELVPTAGTLAPLGLETHDVHVTITDGLAVTEVTQTFFNQHERSIEATYRFPLPRGAALSGCSLWIEGKEVQGEVVRRERAEQIRSSQRRAGRDVATVEQKGFSGFQVRVSPIRPRSRQKVRLTYYQPLEIDQGIGRYVYPLAPGNTEHTRSLFRGRPLQARVRIGAELRSSLPLVDVATPGWPGARVISVSQGLAGEGGHEWSPVPKGVERRRVYLEARHVRLEHDFVLYWRTTPQSQPTLHVLPHRDSGAAEGTFLVTLDPGLHEAPSPEAHDWVIVLDVSGSMRGAKLQLAVQTAIQLLNGFEATDRFTLLAFSDRVRSLGFRHAPANPMNVARATERLQTLRAGGNTGVHAALQAALEATGERNTGVLLFTDGVANVGPASLRRLAGLIHGRDVAVFSFEIGNEANAPLLDHLANISGGFHMDLSSADLVEGRVQQALGKLAHPTLRDVELHVEGVSVSDLIPARLPVLYAGQPLRVLGRYRGHGSARVVLRGRRAGQPIELVAQVELPALAESAPELERLWALGQIRDVQLAMDLSGGRSTLGAARIEALALEYGLVTPYTSLVVVPERDKAIHSLGRQNARRIKREKQARQSPARSGGTSAYGSRAVLQPRAKPLPRRAPYVRPRALPSAPPPRPSTARRPVPRVESLPPEDPYAGPGTSRWRGSGGGFWSGGGGGGGGSLGPLGALLALVLGGAKRRRENAA